jgi:hypothetical protein
LIHGSPEHGFDLVRIVLEILRSAWVLDIGGDVKLAVHVLMDLKSGDLASSRGTEQANEGFLFDIIGRQEIVEVVAGNPRIRLPGTETDLINRRGRRLGEGDAQMGCGSSSSV